MENVIKNMFEKIMILEKENETYKQAYENMKKNNQQLKLYLKIELERYKNIIDELERWLNKNLPIREQQDLQIVIDKLKELKGE